MTRKTHTRPNRKGGRGLLSALVYFLLLLLGFILGISVVFYVLKPRSSAPSPELPRPPKTWDNRLRYLVIHCTATREGQEVSAQDLRLWHTAPPPKGRGWKRVGYTDLIHLDGRIERLVQNDDDDWISREELTNGASGYNLNSIHIAYVGGCDRSMHPKDTRTQAQRQALERYVRDFHRRHPKVEIIGHRRLTDKACPSFDVRSWVSSLRLDDKPTQ